MDDGGGHSAAAVCGVCCSAVAKYTCPKCGVRTCGLSCYRKHKESCGSPQQTVAAGDDDDDGIDDERLCSLLEKLVGATVLSDDQAEALAQSALTKEQMAEFEQRMNSGDLLRQVVAEWVPWWNASKVDIDDDTDGDDSEGTDAEKRLQERRQQMQAARKASPLVRNGVVEMLAVYALLQRYFNGDWSCNTDTSDAALRCLALLGAWRAPEASEAAGLARFRDCFNQVSDTLFGGNGNWIIDAAIQDAALLLQTREHACRALRELAEMLDKASSMRGFTRVAKARDLARKVWFHEAWMELQDTATIIAMKQRTDECAHQLNITSSPSKQAASSVLIEELP